MELTEAEKGEGRLNEDNLELAVRLLLDQGYVVLEDVLPASWVDGMRGFFATALESKYGNNGDELTRTRGHGGIRSGVTLPYTDPNIIENPMAFQIMEQVFGGRFFGCLPYGCNTTFPGSEPQNVHRDCGQLFPELQIALPPALIVVNIALDEFTIENGATQVWPGSHHTVDRTSEEIDYLRVGVERAARYPSTQTHMPAGSVVVRDMRTWHRGMPNSTDKSRTMLSLVYFRPYFVPDDLGVSLDDISAAEWDQFSDRARSVYRLRRG
jgi:hypothetical protein